MFAKWLECAGGSDEGGGAVAGVGPYGDCV
jgi:hypothetical protein